MAIIPIIMNAISSDDIQILNTFRQYTIDNFYLHVLTLLTFFETGVASSRIDVQVFTSSKFYSGLDPPILGNMPNSAVATFPDFSLV